jgi:hypothetical protein
MQDGLASAPFNLINAQFALDAQIRIFYRFLYLNEIFSIKNFFFFDKRLDVPTIEIELKFFDTQSASLDIAMLPYTVPINQSGVGLVEPKFNVTTNLTDLDLLRNLNFTNIFHLINMVK